jgi:hypothetical protein
MNHHVSGQSTQGQDIAPLPRPLPRQWVHADFVMAVILTVIYPMLFLLRALCFPAYHHQRGVWLRYWRTASLLMVAVYGLAGGQAQAAVTGMLARVAITKVVLEMRLDTGWARRWQWACATYCLVGASMQVAYHDDGAVRHEYVVATQLYHQRLHATRSHADLARWARRGWWGWLVVALAEWWWHRRPVGRA